MGLGLVLATTAAPPAMAASARVAGAVWLVEPEKQELVILDAGRRHTLTYSEATIVRQGGRDRVVAELKRGDRVVVTLAADDARRAAIIAVAGPAPADASGRRLLPGTGGASGVPAFAPGLNARTLPK